MHPRYGKSLYASVNMIPSVMSYIANCISTKSFQIGRLRTIVHAIIKSPSTVMRR